MENQSANLCANNCGFFGNPATNNLCSKCYKEFLLEKSKEIEESNSAAGNSGGFGRIKGKGKEKEAGVGAHQLSDSGSSVDGDGSRRSEPNRCNSCKKRVGLTGYQCRCGQTFCSQHRYSDKHNCVYDYKAAAQDAIAKANPVVKADKVDKI